MKALSNFQRVAGAGIAILISLSTVVAAPSIPANLGSGLRAVVEASQRPASRLASQAVATAEFTPDVFGDVIFNDEGAVLVNIVLNGRIQLDQAAAKSPLSPAREC